MNSSELKDLGNNEFRNGNYQSAIKFFDEAIEKDPENHVLYSNRSAAYLSSGEGQKALADAEKCVNLEPTWAKGYGRKGAALHMLKKYDDSIASFEHGLSLETNNSYLQSGLELVKNEKDLTNNNPAFSMDLMQQLMQNEKIRDKVKDPAFVSKMMQYQSNPLSMLQDQEMMEIFGTIMQEMGNNNTSENNNNFQSEVNIMSDNEDTESEDDLSSESDSDESSSSNTD